MHQLLIFPGPPLFGNRMTFVSASPVMFLTPSECNDRYIWYIYIHLHCIYATSTDINHIMTFSHVYLSPTVPQISIDRGGSDEVTNRG